ncbi:MAG TPA: M28 family peptidase [Gemmatimonadaceae bacterium]|jgi:hypothetical protein
MPSAREHLERLAAAPRPAGSRTEADARAWCEAALGAQGFTVSAKPFEYSAVPGRLATPVLGVAGVLLLCAAGHLGWHDKPVPAAAILLVGGACIAVLARWLARRGAQRLPWLRATAVNLVATRGPEWPHFWLVAHIDSKSQPVPILARASGIALLLAVWTVSVVVALAQSTGIIESVAHYAWPWLAVTALVAGAPVAASLVGAYSPGALDNASGVATVLRVAELAHRDAKFGVLITSAEELGLVGARAWVDGAARAAAVNVDGVDDDGPVRLMYAGRRPTHAGILARLTRAMPEARTGRILPGVLVDGVAFAVAGWSAATVSKGTWRTLARIHTSRDDLGALSGTGVESVARALATVVEASD